MRRLIALGLVLFAVGCAKKEEEDELAPPDSLFTTEDLEKGHTTIDSETYIGYEINGSDTFYASTPDYTYVAGSFDECLDERFNAIKASADTVNLMIKADVDITDCPVPDVGPDRTITFTDMLVRVRVWVGCPDGDVEGLDGKTLTELDEVEDDCNEKIDHEVMMNMEFDYEYTQTGTYPDDTSYSVAVASIRREAFQTASGKPCSISHGDGLYTFSDKCEAVSRSISTNAQEGSSTTYSSEDYAKVAYRSITKADAGTPLWFSSGTMETTFNNWSGTVTYSAANVAPTYSLTDGTATVEGTVGGADLRGAAVGGLGTRLRNAVARSVRENVVKQ